MIDCEGNLARLGWYLVYKATGIGQEVGDMGCCQANGKVIVGVCTQEIHVLHGAHFAIKPVITKIHVVLEKRAEWQLII